MAEIRGRAENGTIVEWYICTSAATATSKEGIYSIPASLIAEASAPVSSFEGTSREQLNEMPQVVARGQGEQGQHRLKK